MKNKFWITRSHHQLEREKPLVTIWWKQKPAYESRDTYGFWWCDCRGKAEEITTTLCRQIFGFVPKKHEIYTVEEIEDGYKMTLRQTIKDCSCKNTEIRFGLEW